MWSTARRYRLSLRAATVLVMLSLALGGCTIGPSPLPSFVTSGASSSSAAGTSTATATMPTGPGGPGLAMPPAAWERCPAAVRTTAADGTEFQVRCARVLVPLAYEHPNGAVISLQIVEARDAAMPEAPDAPVLLLLRGDPGTAGVADIADVAAALSADIRRTYLLVTLDVRGTGESGSIECVTPATAAAMVGMGALPGSVDGAAQLRAIGRQLTFDCGDTVGPALTRVNSTAAADDLDAVRAALGVSTMSVLGTGGTATIAAAYVDRYPGRVAAAVLDSPMDALASPEQHAAGAAAAAERLFDDFAAACQDFDGGCPLGDHPRATVAALTARYDSSGVRVGRYVVTGGSVLLTLFELLPDRAAWPALASAIADLDAGSGSALSQLLTEALGGSRMAATLSARVLFTCNDTAERLDVSRIEAASAAAADAAPLFGAYALGPQGWCMSWPAPDTPLARPTGLGAPPVLVIGSILNPVHPFVEAQSVASQLSSAVLLSWQSGVDDAYPASVCVQRAVDSYLLTGSVPERGLLCPP